MKIQDMFEKKITREIKGVIKVGQKDDENVYQELDEYVVTTELEKYMNRFFDAYNRSITGRTDNMGVWISGFFGSGKSHFLKILSYILSNRVVENDEGAKREAVSFFTDGVKVGDDKLKKKIAEIASESGDIDVILFNVDSKSTTDSKINKEAIKDVFMKVFNEYLGYCGSIPFLLNRYPAIFDFSASAYYEKDPAVTAKINEYTNLLYSDTQNEMLKDIDLSLFKENLDIEKVIDIIIFTLRGYSESQASPEKRAEDYSKELERYIKEIDEYIAVLRSVFYKEGE